METESLTTARDSQNRICSICGCSTAPRRIVIAGIEKYVPVICKCEAAAIREREEQERAYSRRQKLESLFKQSRLGDRFRSCTFENYPRIPETERIYNSILEYAENFDRNRNKSILLLSHPGTGKTYLASCIVNRLVSMGIAAIFIVVPDHLNQI
jgi:DNA replication protein DnaC